MLGSITENGSEERFQTTSMQKEIIIRRMREKGCRITRARLTLLDVVMKQECTSCKEIYYIAAGLVPGIGIATVYRMMNLLEEIGANILSKSHRLMDLYEIVLHHHERYDGKGYPEGLKAEQIPVGARIIAICDSIDAMTSNRHYRKAMSLEYCYSEIEKNLGTMYDPIIGKFVLQHWEEVTKYVNS